MNVELVTRKKNSVKKFQGSNLKDVILYSSILKLQNSEIHFEKSVILSFEVEN